MKNRDFKIYIKTVWFLVIGNFLLTIFGALAKIQHWEYSQFFLTVGLMLFFSTWIIILSDMIKNKIYNKSFWILNVYYAIYFDNILSNSTKQTVEIRTEVIITNSEKENNERTTKPKLH